MMDEKQIESLKRRYGSRIADAPKRRRGPERMAVMKGGKPKAGGQTMLRLLSYLKRDRMAMTAAFFCVILGTVTNLAGAYMLRPIINRYIVPLDGSRGDVAGLFRSLCVMGAVYLASVAASYMQSRIMLQVAQNALQRLREELFNHMQTLPLRFYDTGSNGDLMSRFTNDVDRHDAQQYAGAAFIRRTQYCGNAGADDLHERVADGDYACHDAGDAACR